MKLYRTPEKRVFLRRSRSLLYVLTPVILPVRYCVFLTTFLRDTQKLSLPRLIYKLGKLTV